MKSYFFLSYVLCFTVMGAMGATLSLTTETTITSNRTKIVYVFRSAGDMGSTNKITSTRLTRVDTISTLRDSFLTDKELADKQKETGKTVVKIPYDSVPSVVKEEPKEEPLEEPKPVEDPGVKPDPEKPVEEPVKVP